MTAVRNINTSQAKIQADKVRRAQVAQPMRRSSLTQPGDQIRVSSDGNGGVIAADGSLTWNGTIYFTGDFQNDGTFQINGATTINGPTDINGATSIDGTLAVNGTWTISGNGDITGGVHLTGTMTVDGGGKIVVGNLTIDPGGTYGGRITAGGVGVLYLDSVNVIAREYITAQYLSLSQDAQVNGDVNIFGTLSAGTKLFRIEHPSDPTKMLQHGSTESPVSGIEYTGAGEFDDDGECVVDLPPYFEALAKPGGRTVHVSPVGRPYLTGAAEVEDGVFTAYGDAGRKFCWLVKAERSGADFDVEPDAPIPVG